MLIQANIADDAPVEVPILLNPIINQDVNKTNSQKLTHKKRKKCKEDSSKVKKSKTSKSSPLAQTEKNDVPSFSKISVEDIDELKKVYHQCKNVMEKIESKYGHLLDLDTHDSAPREGSKKKRKLSGSAFQNEEVNECQCTLNKKIVFDEEGKEVTIDTVFSDHICPRKLMLHKNLKVTSLAENRNIQIEYHTELSDNLQELRNILRNPEIDTSYRNLIIDKLKLLKQEQSNELKFNKHAILEKIKANPDEMISFQGSNLSGLTGYLY